MTYRNLPVRFQIFLVEAEWRKYASIVRDFDALLDHAKAVSASLVGITPTGIHLGYGEQIFIKLLAHCITLRQLAPDPYRGNPSELWDLPSMSAVARCAIEAHDAFLYVAVGNIDSGERSFRIHLWELHDNSRRRKMLQGIGSQDPRSIEIANSTERLQQKVIDAPFYQLLDEQARREVTSSDPPSYYLGRRKRCEIYGVNYEYYNTITMQLSQHVHTLPFSIHQQFKFKAGNTDELTMMSLPLRYVLPFLSRVTEEMRQLFPSQTPSPPSRTARTMAISQHVYANGLKQRAE